jgi:hypothetical protein
LDHLDRILVDETPSLVITKLRRAVIAEGPAPEPPSWLADPLRERFVVLPRPAAPAIRLYGRRLGRVDPSGTSATIKASMICAVTMGGSS